MTEKEKQERADILKDQLVDHLFQSPDGEFDEMAVQKILDALDELEPLEPLDTKAMLARLWDTVEERVTCIPPEDRTKGYPVEKW